MFGETVVIAYCPRFFIGRVCGIWGPTVLFFPQGIEHAVVTMFVIPVGMVMGAEVDMSHWRFLNKIPVMLGNLVGGMFFTGLAIYYAHGSATIAPQQVQSVNHASSSISA
ncbi:MAG TPA: formate/nitrite transporter family protein [Nitrospirales bacterium]|nr:formate/nitrite transporter family protein [Nitrospirales bacterium]